MNPERANDDVRLALLQVVPDADLDGIAPDEPLRDALELDSLDFLAFVEQLSARTGVRIDEDDYGRLSTRGSCVDFLLEGAASR